VTDQEDRTVSPVKKSGGIIRTAKARNLMLAGGAAAAMGLVYISVSTAINPPPPPQKADNSTSTVIAQVTANPPPLPPPVIPKEAPPKLPPAIVQVKPAPPDVVKQTAHKYVVMPADAGETSFDVPVEDAAAKAAKSVADASKSGEDHTTKAVTQVVFKPSTIEGAKAGPAIDMTYVMMPQLIPCVLETRIDSTVAGVVMCHTTQDVLSPRHVLLMPAGTEITGTYKNDVRQGQNRLFAFVGSAITPEGIPVPLNSQIADGLGASGVPGSVNNHFWSRFGAGILLAGSQSATQLAQALVSKGGNSYFSLNSGGGSNVATEILRQQEQQQPTVTVEPGTEISIVVDHYVDFSDAIKVRLAQ
jgi:type IV secretion system protein VirB10